jgi:hypothetical protein
MKYLLAGFAILLMAFSLTSSVGFSDVRGTSESGGILIQWTTSSEDGIRDFSVVRVSQVDGSYSSIGTVNAAGAGSNYQFLDRAIYKASSASVFVYRVLAMAEDGTTTVAASDPITVSYEFSGLSGVARRTWGSIKAMFR